MNFTSSRDHGLHHSHSEFHVGGGGASRQAGVADWSVPVRLTAGRKFPEWSRAKGLSGTRLTGLTVDIRRHRAQMYSDSVAGAESPWTAVLSDIKFPLYKRKRTNHTIHYLFTDAYHLAMHLCTVNRYDDNIPRGACLQFEVPRNNKRFVAIEFEMNSFSNP